VRIYTPFLKYLEKTTGKHFRIKFTAKYEDTVENLGKGITQFDAVGTLSYVIGREKYGIKYLVSGVNNEGDPKYRAMIITRPDSEIYDIKDLKGKSFAFGSRMSTQGHLIPRKMLEDVGITLKDLSYYIYTGSHVNVVRTVLSGEYDAGGIQDTLAKRLASEGKIRILKMSDPYPSSLIAYNSNVDRDTLKAVKATLLAFEPTGKHKNILHEWDKTGMPLGFTVVDDSEIDRVAILAKIWAFTKMKLRTKIALFTIVIAVSVGFLITLSIRGLLLTPSEENLKKAESIAGTLPERIADLILLRDYFQTTQALNEVLQKELEYIFVTDEEGNLFAHTFKNGIPPDILLWSPSITSPRMSSFLRPKKAI